MGDEAKGEGASVVAVSVFLLHLIQKKIAQQQTRLHRSLKFTSLRFPFWLNYSAKKQFETRAIWHWISNFSTACARY